MTGPAHGERFGPGFFRAVVARESAGSIRAETIGGQPQEQDDMTIARRPGMRVLMGEAQFSVGRSDAGMVLNNNG